MPKLILNASNPGKIPFDDILKNGKGTGYAIPKWIKDKLYSGCTIVLLDKKKQRRAEGTLVNLIETGAKTPQGLLRYDVHIKNLKTVSYKNPPETINHWGTGYDDDC